MQTLSISKSSQILLIVCSLMLVAVLFVPMWRIDLDAPQYPEGLRLLIYPSKLAGNVDIINGLNHYIGMKTLHTEDFVEFTILPYIIGLFAAGFLVTALLKKRKIMNFLLAFLFVFGIVAMADFWNWEYNYGHNLNPDAAIIVPGMAYQPPLIGFKQLLNFGAYSVPDIGGWLFIGAGAILLFCVILETRKVRAMKKSAATVITLLFLSASISSCSTQPSPIKLGIDNCSSCSMTITNPRFGAEAITKKGKIYKYDEIGCLLSHLEDGGLLRSDIKEIYTPDFSNKNELINIENSHLLKSDALRSPMGSNIAAFAQEDSLQNFVAQFGGEKITWMSLYK